MTTLLTDKELVELTDYRSKAKQIEQLRRMHIPFWVGASGRPKVLRASLVNATSVHVTPEPEKWSPAKGEQHGKTTYR